MNHVDFIIWMIFYPFFTGILSIMDYKYGRGKEYSANARGLTALIHVFIWALIGVKLF